MGLLTTWALLETGIHLVMTNTSLGDKIGYNDKPEENEGKSMYCEECGHKCKTTYKMDDGRMLAEVCAADYLGVTVATFRKIANAYKVEK